jgi:hypothetical protein
MRHAVLVGLVLLLGTRGVVADPPPAATAAFSRAQVAIAGRDWDVAIRLLGEAVEAAPDYWEAHRSLGECYLRLNKPDEARPHLERALKLKPGDPATQAMLTRVTELQKAEAAQMALAIQARDRLVKQQQQEKGGKQPRPLGDFARNRPSPLPSSAPVDPMRARAASIFRARMVAAAPTLKALLAADRRFRDACGQTGPVAGYATGRYTSEAAWRSRFERETAHANDETPDCRAIAGQIRDLSSRLAAAMDGVDRELASPPPVNPTVREEVFARLASELW